MLLRKLRLTNFRQFKGEQSISFSINPDRNVTIIMGENGSGKTTLAQTFTWCLYGDTEFEDKTMISKAVAQNMLPNEEANVRVDLELVHNGMEYTIIREQKYSMDSSGSLRRPSQTIFKIAYKGLDGQREFVPDLETDLRMKEILPRELSKYFFFDGERIENMSKEIRLGKSKEFAEAVKSLLGLNAFTAALDHLKSRSSSSVIRSYDNSYDAGSDVRISQYTKEIDNFDDKIEAITNRLAEIDNEEAIAQDKCKELEEKISKFKDSEVLTKERESLRKKLNRLISSKASSTTALLRSFNNNVQQYFAKKMMKDALQRLSEAEKIDKGIPDIHERTIKFLIDRGFCICGNKIVFNNEAYKDLMKVLDYIPPQSLGSLIGQFVRDCELKSKGGSSLFEEVSEKYRIIRDFAINYTELENNIKLVEQRLENMENVGKLQKDLINYESRLNRLKTERDNLNKEQGSYETQKKLKVAERKELTLKDATNRKIEVYKAYAQYMYDVLFDEYTQKEAETRNKLQETVNRIFKHIYNGGLSLSLNENYNINIIVNDFEGYNSDVETSTAQRISVIFAFIAGVIKMARDSQNDENEMLVSEPYPLVMDAPLSAFDKTRIQTVCDTLPKIAEQVIIFIKDTDGELAETFLGQQVGTRYLFNKKNEFETYLGTR